MKLMKLLYPNQHCLISKSRLVFLYFCLKKVFQKLPVGLNCLRLYVVRTLPKQLMGKCDTYLYGGGGGGVLILMIIMITTIIAITVIILMISE